MASYSSRGLDVNNALLQTADVLKPNITARGSLFWAAWSPNSEGDPCIKALIKQKHPNWSPAAITSAMMTTADTTDHFGSPILAKSTNQLALATPFNLGAGSINPARAIDPGLVFDAHFVHIVQFLFAVPGVDDGSVRQAVRVGWMPKEEKGTGFRFEHSKCSDFKFSWVTKGGSHCDEYGWKE